MFIALDVLRRVLYHEVDVNGLKKKRTPHTPSETAVSHEEIDMVCALWYSRFAVKTMATLRGDKCRGVRADAE